jgi:hypothetical protein
MNHLRRLGSNFSIPIKPDEDGFTGRECPNPPCEGYFKVEFGTGLKGSNLPCHCPYCGHVASHDQFWTKEQVEYARSAALRKVTDAIHKDLKKLEFDHRPKRGGFGIGLSLKVKPGRPVPIRYYREKKLETVVVCDKCTLRYSVYGVFAFCPDCGQHNSLQILNKNLELVDKMLDLAAASNGDLRESLTENALEDCVSSFDAFGRELCRVYAHSAADPAKAVAISFQNLEGAKRHVSIQFGLDLAGGLDTDEWKATVRGFQKRHLLSHKMGVVDDDYIRKSGDTLAVVGRRISVDEAEVCQLVQLVSKLGQHLSDSLQNSCGCQS